MKTISKLMNNKQIAFLLFVFLTPIASFAQHATSVAEQAAADEQTALIGEISIAVLFIVAVTAFLIYKAKHDKKVREKQTEQMKKVQAARRRAA